MKSLLTAVLTLTAVLAAVPALADPTAAAAPPTIKVPEHTFVIHLDKPHVVVDIKVPTAAAAAGAAHDAFRERMMRQSEPPALRPAH